MQENRLKGVQELFKLEGFSSNLSGDAPTILGWNQKWFPVEYKMLQGFISQQDIAGAYNYASSQYIEQFWIPLGADDLPYPEDIDTFCEAVNDGLGTVEKLMQGCTTAEEFLAKCDQHYKDIVAANPAKAIFLKGWLNRDELLREAFPEAT